MSSPATGEAGFTFVEVLVALVVLAVAGTALAGSLSAGAHAVGAIGASVAETARLAGLDDSLRSWCARVRAPYWQPGPSVTTTDTGLRVGWLDGRAERELSVETGRDGVTIGDGRVVERFSGFAGSRVSLLRDDGARRWAVRLELALSDSRRVAIVAGLGGAPIAGAGP